MKRILVMALLLAGCEQHITDVLFARDLAGDGAFNPGDMVGPPNPSTCSTADVLLCDGFESAITPGKPWEFVIKGATPSLDTTRAYRGAASLHVVTDAAANPGGGQRQGELTETKVIPTTDFYNRFFFYLPSPTPAWDFRIFGDLQANTPNGGPEIFIGSPNALSITPGNNATDNSSVAMPTDRWVCVEMEVLTGTSGQIHLWLDGNEVTQLAFAGDTTISPALGRVSIGIGLFAGPAQLPVYNFWFDEVALDDKRIGCVK